MSSHLDDVLRALADSDRRRVLATLAACDPGGEDVLTVPGDVPVENGRVRLHHVHLPNLEDAGLIHWDRDRDEVRKGPRFSEAKPILNVLKDDPDKCVVCD